MSNLFLGRLKEVKQLQNNVDSNELDYKIKSRMNYNFTEISLPIIWLRNIPTGVWIIEDANKERIKLFKELTDTNKGEKPIKKSLFHKT